MIEVLRLGLITRDGNLLSGVVHLAGELLEGLDIRLELTVLLGNRLRDEDDNGTDGAEIQRRRSRSMLNFGRTWAGATTALRRGERVGIRLPSEGTCDPSPQTASVSSGEWH